MDSIFHRISTRHYLPTPVEEEKVTKLMKAAMAAPSACNQQPWEFYLVTKPEKIAELGTVTPYALPAGRAPLVIVPCYRNEGLRAPSYAQIDLSACVENILLEADSLGLGTCWMGIAPQEDRMAAVKEMLSIPDTLSVFCLISVGYPEKMRLQEDRYEEDRIHRID